MLSEKDFKLMISIGLGTSILYFLLIGDLKTYFLVLLFRISSLLLLSGPLKFLLDKSKKDSLTLFSYFLVGFLTGLDLLFVLMVILSLKKLVKKVRRNSKDGIHYP